MKKEKFPEGKLIFSEGEPGVHAYRIDSGSVEIFIQENGQKLVLAMLGAGEIFGEMAMLENRPRSASARSLEATEVEVIERNEFMSSLESGGEQMLPILSSIFERLRVTNERLLSALEQLDKLEPSKSRRHQETFGIEPAPLKIRLESDSDEMRHQAMHKERLITRYPFMFGRRGEIIGDGGAIHNQLLIADSSPYRISRKHCILESGADAIYVEDSASRLGTIVNGIRIGGKSHETRVRLSLGENTLVLGGPDSQIRFRLYVEMAE